MTTVETRPWVFVGRWGIAVLLVGLALLGGLAVFVERDRAFERRSVREDAIVISVAHHLVRVKGGHQDEPTFVVDVAGPTGRATVTGLGVARPGDRVSVLVDRNDPRQVESQQTIDSHRVYYLLLGLFGAILTGVGLLSTRYWNR